MKVDKYFLCHYTKLQDRKELAQIQLEKNSIEAEWIIEFDQENINFETLDIDYKNISSDKFIGRKLRKSEISLILKHEECLKRIVDSGHKNTIIFEDDIVLCENFKEMLDRYISQLPSDYDILWIGSCCDLHHFPLEENKNVYQNFRGSRCTHAFLISLECAKKILPTFKDIYYPTDFFYNKSVKDFGLKSFWAEPELVRQNSNFKSSIQI